MREEIQISTLLVLKIFNSSNYCGKEIFRNGNFTKSSLYEGRCFAVLGEVFAEGEIDTVYLNFSDPWPKKETFKEKIDLFFILGCL